jgi:hypothetical protein
MRAGGVARVIEHLPSKHKALNSNPSIAKKKLINTHTYKFDDLDKMN